MSSSRRLCVFCGSRPGLRPDFMLAGRELGSVAARSGFGIVYGGAAVGVMGAVADAALAAGGEVIGVIPQKLVDREIAHRGVTQLRVVQSLAERKAQMEALSDAFVALPGGFGTLDELFEMVTAGQLGLHQKPVGLLDVAGFYRPLVDWIERAVQAGFIPAQHARELRVEREPAALLRALLP